MTNCEGTVYAKNDTELSWLIVLDAICDET